jgi:tRNA threonylcarbamoyladenosine biosynthesis protein TsaE
MALGRRLGAYATPGTVVALVGDLGAGKTLFSRGVGEGLGVPSRVNSPTFVLAMLHTGGRLALWHADFYRLADVEELEQLGLDEAMEGDGLVLVEWADRFEAWMPSDHLRLTLTEHGEGRRVQVQATGPRHRALEAILVQ